jgi:hypothetical protein
MKISKIKSVLILLSLLTLLGANSAYAASDKALIRNLYYGLQQAMQNGSASGIAYIEKNNYPNVVTMGANWQKWKAAEIQAGYKEMVSPDLTSMDTDPEWMWGAGFCHAAMTKPPKGKTYIFTVNATTTISTGQSQTASQQVHATVLNGRAYFYFTICKSAN